MSGFTVEYLIALRDAFSAAAERVAKSAAEARASIGKMGKTATEIDGQMAKAAQGMNRVAVGAERATQAVGALSKANSKAAQIQAREHELWFKNANAQEQVYMRQLRSREANMQLRADRPDLFPTRGGSGGLGIMGGMFALSMLHNDVTQKWEDFDDQMRKMRGTLAGQLTDADITALRKSAMETARGTIFSGTDIAKIMMAEAERGVPLNERTANGQLLGGVIAKQMLGIATATGESPEETFKTHLAIQRGFELQFKDFPHISDTIARIHQKTGISLKQIETQMGQISSFAHSAGWTEEQTVGAVGFLAKRGMGQFAGSGLARIISKTQHWSKPAQQFWHKLGINKEDVIDKATGGMLAPDKLMQLLQDHTKGMRQADIAAAFATMFGDRGVKVAAAMLNGDPKELRAMIEDLTNIDGLAEKMGVEGSKGGAAGLKRFAAAWENLKISLGESGFGDQVGWLASKFGDMFDSIATGPNWAKEAAGWSAAGLNMLSDAALPIMALSTIAPGIATGISAVGRAMLSMTKIAGLSGLAADASLLAGSLRAIAGIGGVGLTLAIGYAVVANWDKIAAAAERLAAALGKIKNGDVSGGLKDTTKVLGDVNKSLGDKAGELSTSVNKQMPWWLQLPDPSKRGLLDDAYDYVVSMPDRFKLPSAADMPKPSRGSPRGAPSAADAASNAQAAAAARTQAEVHVRTTLDPIQVHVPPTVTLQGTLSGNGITANVNGSMPMSATAPRGQTMSEPAAPRVAK